MKQKYMSRVAKVIHRIFKMMIMLETKPFDALRASWRMRFLDLGFRR